MDDRSGDIRWLDAPPELRDPLLIVMLTGWIDVGGSARAAAEAIAADGDATPFLEFDDDAFIDFRARRPTMELREGLHSVLVWERIQLAAGHDRTGRDLLLLTGPEPDMAWHRFTRHVVDLATRFGVTEMAHLGTYPFAVPHTRPSRLSVSSPSVDVLTRVPFLRSSIDVPGGAAASIEMALHSTGIPTIGIWAQVPHYVNQMAYAGASVALLDGLREATGAVVDAAELRNEAIEQGRRLDELIARNDEHSTMLRQLEQIYDASDDGVPVADAGPTMKLASGDELAAELEKYLREQS